MSRLKELSEFKDKVITKICDNQNILKALQYNDKDFLDKPDINEPSQLVFKKIYPFNFIPTSAEELERTNAYITISVTDYKKAGSIHFNAGSLFVYIYMHKSLIQTNYGYLRTDYIASEIHDMLDQQRGFGIGKLEFVGAKELSVNSDFHGVYLQYRPVEFN